MTKEDETRRDLLKAAAVLTGAAVCPLAFSEATPRPAAGSVGMPRSKAIQALSDVPLGSISISGALSHRYQRNIDYLLWRFKDIDRMLFPFEHRDQWLRTADWDGEYVGKWLDAAVLMAECTAHPALIESCNNVAARLRAAQHCDGYLGAELVPNRLHPWWPLWIHWLAMKGLREHGQRFGDAESLRAMTRAGDWLFSRFYPITDGNSPFFQGELTRVPEQISRTLLPAAEDRLGTVSVMDELVELYEITGLEKYLEFAAQGVANCPSLRMVLQARKVLPGHAYNLMTYLGAAVRVAQVRQDLELIGGLEAVWTDIAQNHLFPTGSVSTDEVFKGPPIDAPNAHQQETCATVEWITFTYRLYLATGQVRYINMIERTVRNALLGAQSTDGKRWTYYTPLRAGKAWFIGPTDCCYFSGPRGIARLPQLLYHRDDSGIRVDLFESSRVQTVLNATPITLSQQTNYPVSGLVTITVDPQEPVLFTLKVRLPEQCVDPCLRVNGVATALSATAGRHVAIRRTWQAGDKIELTFEPIAWLALMADQDAVAMRGVEALAADYGDNPDSSRLFEKLRLPPSLEFQPIERSGDGRARYRAMADVDGQVVSIVLTPFAQAGNAAIGQSMLETGYRTAFPTKGRSL